MNTNTGRFAEQELDILIKTIPDATVAPFRDEILALCDKFGASGQSGGSAPYVAAALGDAVKKLCLQKSIAPITGDADEWVDVTQQNEGEILYQNKRCSALFKDSFGNCWYLNAIIWKDQNGHTFSGPAWKETHPFRGKVVSRQYIKGFPFKPKTFYIDVISVETKKDDWDFFVAEPSQLEKVWEYYKNRDEKTFPQSSHQGSDGMDK